MSLKKIIFLIIVFFVNSSQAIELYESYRSVRALGLGNAYQSLVTDGDSLFYNPAGLARARGLTITLLDLGIGLGGLDAMSEVNDIVGSSDISDVIAEIYGEPIWGGASGKVGFTIPYFSVAAYGFGDVAFKVNNPVLPDIDVGVVMDYGVAAGLAYPVLDWLHIGASGRYIQRKGARRNFAPSDLINFDPQPIEDALEQEGNAIALDAGVSLVYPGRYFQPAFSVVMRNIGDTSFSVDSGTTPPPSDAEELSASAAIAYDSPLFSLIGVADYRYINRNDIDETKKIHIGAELGLAIFDFRAGLHQGYPSYGAGMSFGIGRVDIASYGVELGETAGQIEDRRYLLQMSFEIGFSGGRVDTSGSTAGSRQQKVKSKGRRGMRGERSTGRSYLKQRR